MACPECCFARRKMAILSGKVSFSLPILHGAALSGWINHSAKPLVPGWQEDRYHVLNCQSGGENIGQLRGQDILISGPCAVELTSSGRRSKADLYP